MSLLLCKFQRVQTSILREEWVISGTQAPSGPGSWEGQVRAGKRRDEGSHHCLCIDFAPPGVLITSHPWYQPIFECKPWYMGKSWVDWDVKYDIRWQMSNLWNLLSSISIHFTKFWGKGKEINEEVRVISESSCHQHLHLQLFSLLQIHLGSVHIKLSPIIHFLKPCQEGK